MYDKPWFYRSWWRYRYSGGGRLLRNGNEFLTEENGAKIDASNLTDENKESWRNSLISAGNGINIDNGVISAKSKINLLWSSPNVTVSFAPQSINLNLKDYDFVIVEFGFNTDYPNLATTAIGVINGSPTQAEISTYNNTYRRTFWTYDTGLYFETGVGVSDAENNKVTIPKTIYGVKI